MRSIASRRLLPKVALSLFSSLVAVVVLAPWLMSSSSLRAASPASTVSAAASVQWLHVEGNKLVNESGSTVILRGVNIENREWIWRSNPNIDYERRAVVEATEAPPEGWGANAILLAVASGPVNRRESRYLSALDEIIALAKARGAHTILSYRYSKPNTSQPNMPDQAAEDAMAALAARYANEPAVIYSLQVEPHDVSWSQLKPRLISMTDAIRRRNSKALVAIPGTQWGRYVHWALTDPIPRDNLVYKSHVYDSWSTVRSQYRLDALSAKYPVILGEFGAGGQMDLGEVIELLDFVEDHGISWVAWLFHEKGCPCLLSNSSTFATTAYGAEIKERLQEAADAQPVPPADPPALTLSRSPDRSRPVKLDNATVSGDIYVFVTPESGIVEVRFYLDDPNMRGGPHQTERFPAFDLEGTRTDGTALPFNTTELSPGTHQVTAAITFAGGQSTVVHATFTVQGAPPPTATPSPRPSPTPTPRPSPTATPAPTRSPTPIPTATPILGRLALLVETRQLSVGETAPVPVVLSEAPSGVAGYALEVSLADATIARIAGVESPDFDLTHQEVLSDSKIRVAAADTERAVQDGARNAVLFLVKLQGLLVGTTPIEVRLINMDDDVGNPLRPDLAFGRAVVIKNTCPSVASRPSQDVDGDGHCEDVNGNGRLDYADVVELFARLESLADGPGPYAFDFNGNGRLDMDDISALFLKLAEREV